MARRITGILSTGKIIPDKTMVGIINIIPEASMAATCVLVTEEISKPKASDTKIKSKDTITSQNKLPTTGTSSTKTESSKMVVRLTKDKTK